MKCPATVSCAESEQRLLARVIGAVLICALAIAAYNNVAEYLNRLPSAWRANDFNHYYLSAQALADTSAVYGVEFRNLPMGAEFYSDPYINHPTNPPGLMLLTLPLVLLSAQTAWIVWQVVLGVALVGCVLVSISLSGIKILRALPVFALASLACRPLVEALLYSQAQPILLLLLLLGIQAYLRERRIAAGLYWGMTIALKFYAWPLLCFLLAKRATRSLAAAFTSIGLVVMSISVIFGFEIWRSYLLQGLPASLEYSRLPVINYGFPFLVLQLAEAAGLDPLFWWNAAAIVSTTAIGAVAYHLGRISVGAGQDLLTLGSILTLSVAALQPAWYHYCSLTIVGFLGVLRARPSSDDRRGAIIALYWSLLMLVPINSFSGRGTVERLLLTSLPVAVLMSFALLLLCRIRTRPSSDELIQ